MKTLTFERLNEFFTDQITEDCIERLKEFRFFLDTLNPSTNTHYDRLDETRKPIYDFVRKALYGFGFVNGNPEETNKKPNARFWWSVYGEVDCFQYSKFFNQVEGHNDTARHHVSAYVRVECLKKELDNFIELKGL